MQNCDFLKSTYRKACFLNRTYPNTFSFLNLTEEKDTEISEFWQKNHGPKFPDFPKSMFLECRKANLLII